MAAVSVTTTATRLDTTGSDMSDTRPGQSILLYHDGTNDVFLGRVNTVTTSGATKGVPLKAGQYMAFDLEGSDALYGIVASGTESVLVLETGL